MSAPRFSVVCPAYNARLTIDATVRSVLGQSYEDFELIVVDDGSSDETPQRVEAFASQDPRVRLIRQPNAGTAGARNTGFAEARGSLISIIDNDDLWLPGYLTAIGDALAANPEAGLAFCDIWVLEDRTRRVHRKTLDCTHGGQMIQADRLEIELLRRNFVPASAATLTRGAIEATGGFEPSPELSGSDDWDLWLRVGHAGFGAVKAAGALAIWRDRAGSESKDALMMARGANLAARRALERNPGSAEFDAAVQSLIESTERDIAAMTDGPWFARARTALRTRLGAVKRRVLHRRYWRRPPDELARFLERVDPQGA